MGITTSICSKKSGSWKDHLDDPGARHLTYIANLVRTRPKQFFCDLTLPPSFKSL